LFDRMIHRFGDSTYADHACLMTFPGFRGQWFTIGGLQPADGEGGRIGIMPVG
jgi:hypothetical protein